MLLCFGSDLLYPSATTFPTFFFHFNSATSSKTQVPTHFFSYFESRKFFSLGFTSPIPRLFLKLLGLSEKNGGHVLSRYCCWREWIPLPFSKKFNFLKEPVQNIYFLSYFEVAASRVLNNLELFTLLKSFFLVFSLKNWKEGETDVQAVELTEGGEIRK